MHHITHTAMPGLDLDLGRREFLALSARSMSATALAGLSASLAACGGGKAAPQASDEPDVPDTGNPTIPPATREYTVLKRTSFGVSQRSMQQIQAVGVDAYLEQQLAYEALNDSELESTIRRLFPLAFQSSPQLLAGFPDNFGDVVRDVIGATQYRQIYSTRQLYEVMVEFWSDHFNIHLLNGLEPTLKPVDDLAVIRPNALGNFRDLLFASARSPAMLFYLDNFNNLASAPNENYARELMELHTLGVDGGYTEQDIKEVARCFTGWSISFPGSDEGYGQFVFQSAWHDTGSKSVLGTAIPAGGGLSDGEQVLDLLAAHPATARFIATKLCRRFIHDDPDTDTVNTVATAFLDASGDIRETLRALFATQAFLTTADSKFIRPAEYLAQVVRALLPNPVLPDDNGELFFFAQSILGQLPFNWSTPDGYPDTLDYWASTSGLLNRWRLSFLSFAGQLPDLTLFRVDYQTLLEQATTLAGMVDALVNSLLMRPMSTEDRDYLVGKLSTEYGVNDNTDIGSDNAIAIAPLIAAVLISSAYFQLR